MRSSSRRFISWSSTARILRFVTSISLTASLPRAHLERVMDGTDESGDVERFREVSEHALTHEPLDARWRGVRTQDDHRDITRRRVIAQPLQHQFAVDLRQVQIEENQIGQLRACLLQAVQPVRCAEKTETVSLQCQ